MKGECLSYYINTKLKPNDHPLTNYSHFNDPSPQTLIRTEKLYFPYIFTVNISFLIVDTLRVQKNIVL